MSMFVWKKKYYLINNYLKELEWIYNVIIIYDNCCISIYGSDLDDCNKCYCWIDYLMKGGKYE